MKINEIFYSIQGEGKWIGLPNIFIRTAGCNLRCNYCDTKFAYEDGKEMSIKKILTEISKYNCNFVCITGGEPLLQEDTFELINSLLKRDYSIIIETNGSMNIKPLINFKKLVISLDIKCPSSNMEKKMEFDNLSQLKKEDQIKFIVKDRKDFDYAKKIIKNHNLKCEIYIQPVWGSNQKKIANWIIEDELNARLSLQLHKIIWGEKRRV